MVKDRMSFSALGGLGEIGLNCYLYNIFNDKVSEYLMVDLGMGFKDGALTSIETFYPDVRFMEQLKQEIKGLLITHGHEDHIGAIAHLWQFIECPIYATAFTADLIREKLKEYHLDGKVNIIVVDKNKYYKIGKFEVKWLTIHHSIPDSNIIVMKTPLGNIVHSGDFKLNYGDHLILKDLPQIKNEKIEYLFCDSTNVLEEGRSGDDLLTKPSLKELIQNAPAIAWITLFSSNLERIAIICEIAKETNKKIVLLGRSLDTYVGLGIKHKIVNDFAFISIEEAKHMKPNQLIYLVTGSQGEDRSTLHNVIFNAGYKYKLGEKDIVIFSSRVIPGNEQKLTKYYNKLASMDTTYYTSDHYKIHVSGHPKKEELKDLYKMVEPNYIVPMHGDIMHLKAHSSLAYSLGYNSFNCLNGNIIELFTAEPTLIGQWDTGKLCEEGHRLISANEDFLRVRTKIFYEGTVFVSLNIIFGKNIVPKISFLGLLTLDEEKTHNDYLCEKLKSYLISTLQEMEMSEEELSEKVRIFVRKYCKDRLDKKPIVQVHVHVID